MLAYLLADTYTVVSLCSKVGSLIIIMSRHATNWHLRTCKQTHKPTGGVVSFVYSLLKKFSDDKVKYSLVG